MSSAQIPIERAEEKLQNADRIWHLRQTGLMDGLSRQQAHEISMASADRIYKRKSRIFRHGESADLLFILNRGTVRLSVGNTRGREKIVEILKPGDLFGEEVLGFDRVRRSQAIAHEECWVSVLHHTQLLSLLKSVTGLGVNLLRILNKRLLEARNELEILSLGDAEERIARLLLKLSREHGKSIVSDRSARKLKISISHEQVAQMIGANRPHVSSILSQFRKRGLIRYDRRKLLINIPRVSQLLSENRSHES